MHLCTCKTKMKTPQPSLIQLQCHSSKRNPLHFTPLLITIPCNGTIQVITLMIMSFDGAEQRIKPKLQLWKQTSTYRKASSFVRRQSDADSSNSIGLKPSTSKDVDLINKSRINRGSDALTPDHMMEGYSSDSSTSECNFIGSEDKYSFPALFPELEELIRELSFSPPRPKKKRANTADTETSSFSSSETSLEPKEHRRNTISLDLDVKHSQERSRPSSPLLGLQYLPDH